MLSFALRRFICVVIILLCALAKAAYGQQSVKPWDAPHFCAGERSLRGGLTCPCSRWSERPAV